MVALYQQRGRFARPFLHSSMGVLTATSILIAPVIAQGLPNAISAKNDPWQSVPAVLSASTQNPQIVTGISDKLRDRTEEYEVKEGDTVASIAQKYGISEDTIRWQNDIKKDKLKVGQKLQILPVTGVSYRVKPGDTIYSIAKKHTAEPQAIVDFPFNTFVNDETFELAVGQVLIIPEGVPPKAPAAPSGFARRRTPDAGTVVASGSFVWPTSGDITQGFSWYHRGIDVANKAAPDVLAADSGTVTYSGCVAGGYGCHVVIDHGNGYSTLYAHFQQIYVEKGQTIARGNAVGKMGSTGRSTGTHLHFEIRTTGSFLNPLEALK